MTTGEAAVVPAGRGRLRPAEPHRGMAASIDNQPTDLFNRLSGEAT